MLTAEDNDLLCRVEGDAPMGRLMRAHWIPACLSEEVAERDGAPVRIRLLGEDLVAFRDSDRPARRARRALPAPPRVARARPQRGMRPALPLPRLEDRRRRQHRRPPVGAARATASAKSQARDLSVPRGRRLRLGVDGRPDAAARFEPPAWAPSPDIRTSIVKMHVDCNWAQVLEGAIDSAHSSSLHSTDMVPAQVDGAGATDERVAAAVDRQGAAAARRSAPTSASATSRFATRSRTPRRTITCASRCSSRRSPC